MHGMIRLIKGLILMGVIKKDKNLSLSFLQTASPFFQNLACKDVAVELWWCDDGPTIRIASFCRFSQWRLCIPTATIFLYPVGTMAAFSCSRRNAAVQFGVLPAYKPQEHANLLWWSYKSLSTLRSVKGCEVALFRWLVVFAFRSATSMPKVH